MFVNSEAQGSAFDHAWLVKNVSIKKRCTAFSRKEKKKEKPFYLHRGSWNYYHHKFV